MKIKSIINKILMKSSQLMQKIHLPSNICIKYNDFHHNIVNKELSLWLNNTYELFLNNKYDYHFKQNISNKVIWTFWWQGENYMPLIVKKCINSIRYYSNGHKVILLTKYNINKYVSMPSYIYNKFYNGYISITQFSDILRFNLLKNYGGLWIDSTIYCTSDLSDKYFKEFYTSNVGYDKYHFSISLGKWTGFLIGGDKGQPIFNFMDIFFQYYWKYNYDLIDYFMIDYVLNYAYNYNIGNFKYYVDNCDYQKYIFELMNNIEHNFNSHLYDLMTKNTNCFKLTYKKNISYKKNTFYYRLINNNL